jgi:nucleoid DNA-binding protein
MADKPKAMNKSQLVAAIAEETELSKKQVGDVLASLDVIIKKQLGKKGPGMFTMPGLFKMTTRRLPAVKARKGIDPFTKQERMFAAKPARTQVRIRPLKAVKDAV